MENQIIQGLIDILNLLKEDQMTLTAIFTIIAPVVVNFCLSLIKEKVDKSGQYPALSKTLDKIAPVTDKRKI